MAAGVLAVLLLPGCSLPRLNRPAPLRARNQHPAQLTVLLPGATAGPQEGGRGTARVTFDWTSLWLLPDSGQDEIHLDGDLLRTVLHLQFGLIDGLDVQVELPVTHASGGELDSFVEGWHDLFGLPDSRRSSNPRNKFRVDATTPQGTAYELDNHGVHLGDVPILLSWFPFRNLAGGPLSFGVRGGVELPTGDDDDGVGNGGLDASVGVLGAWEGQSFAVFGWGDHTWVHRPDRAKDVGLEYPDVFSAGLGVEVAVLSQLSLIGQLQWEQSVLRRLDQENAEKDQVNIWMGGRVRFGDQWAMEFGVAEDLVGRVSPDVTIHLGLSYGF